MADREYRATLSQSQKRSGWCMIFRHPLQVDRAGRVGLRIRRGLGTTNKEDAQRLVEQMNKILNDPTLHTPMARETAAKSFDPIVVRAFYEDLAPAVRDWWEDRNSVIPLPGAKEGYTRIQLVGTTGAGKTTLVRQLIGTDPEKDRFPSTSTAKTTTYEAEIIIGESPFRGVVSFISKDQVRQYIEESVLDAIGAFLDGKSDSDVARKLLYHSEQRFRLAYLLGTLNENAQGDEELSDDADDADSLAADTSELSHEEREKLVVRLKYHLDALKSAANKGRDEVVNDLPYLLGEATPEQQDEFHQQLEERISQHDDFHHIIDELLDDVESRFELLEGGYLEKEQDGWPIYWAFSDSDRAQFIQIANRFSSNYAPNFGRLLTPLVQGIRVCGPFGHKELSPNGSKLVIMDGEGLGHTPASAASVSTSVTRRFKLADVIVLVDNAAQPMQAAPQTVLSSVLSGGYESKLALCFTHFDEVKGDNLPDIASKKAHVLGSRDNAIAALGKTLGRVTANTLRRILEDRTFFLSKIQEPLSPAAKLTRFEFGAMLAFFDAAIAPLELSAYKPVYDDANLILAVQQAIQDFREPWRARLGLSSTASVRTEHWARIKALTRHIGMLGEDEYQYLRPVADLIARLSEHVSLFLMNPLRWKPQTPPEDVVSQATASIKQHLYDMLHDFAKNRVLMQRIRDWVGAFEQHSGPGSTRYRARHVESIYDLATPIPTGVPEPAANELLTEIRALVREAIKKGGGELVSG